MNPQRFDAFYQRGAAQGVGGRLAIAILLGLIFLAAHALSTGTAMFQDWSWMLGVLIACAMLAVYYATATLKGLFPGMEGMLQANPTDAYLDPLTRTLGDGRFIAAGIFFGALNALLGYAFGTHYAAVWSQITLLAGFFAVGFICGMAALGIRGVIVAFRAFAREGSPALDFQASDRRGGTWFLGEALVKFCAVTLLMAILISAYLLNAPWTNLDKGWVSGLFWFWLAFPYLLAIVVLLRPSAEIHRLLERYKEAEVTSLRKQSEAVESQLAGLAEGDAKRQSLAGQRELFAKQLYELDNMKTWPAGI